MRQQQTLLRSDRKSLPWLPARMFFSFLETFKISKEMKSERERGNFLALFSLLAHSSSPPSPQAKTPHPLTRRTPPFSRNAGLSQAPLPGTDAGKERAFRPKRGGSKFDLLREAKNYSTCSIFVLFLSKKLPSLLSSQQRNSIRSSRRSNTRAQAVSAPSTAPASATQVRFFFFIKTRVFFRRRGMLPIRKAALSALYQQGELQ